MEILSAANPNNSYLRSTKDATWTKRKGPLGEHAGRVHQPSTRSAMVMIKEVEDRQLEVAGIVER